MSILDQVREKYKAPSEGTSKTFKSPSAGFAGPQKGESRNFSDKTRGRAPSLAEARRQKLLQTMAEDDTKRANYCLTDTESDPDYVILAFAIRGVGTGELSIPRDRYDPFLLGEMLDKVHRSLRGPQE